MKRTTASALALIAWALSACATPGSGGVAGAQVAERPFGTLREQAELEQAWLRERLDTVLPALLRREGVQMWIVPMREYAEDPVFRALAGPTSFSARRRTIFVFFDRGPERGVERLVIGGGAQGGLYEVRRVQQPDAAGNAQWQELRRAVDERGPRTIAVDVSRTHALADGLTAGERDALLEALGPELAARIRPAESLAIDLLATRVAGEEAVFRRMNALAWQIIDTAFSRRVIEPGQTRPSDVVWWMRQRLDDLGLSTWFQPSVELQRQGVPGFDAGDLPIERGDVLHCDFGITALRLNTDTQHMAYVLREGEREPPTGLRAALARGNELQEIVLSELRAGRSGNEMLASALARMRAATIDGSIYSHPVGLHGHAAGPLIGLWDHQEGVPGRGELRAVPMQWFAVELQATTPVAEWGGQPVRMALEEDAIVGADGVARWAHGQQKTFHLVR